MAKEIKSAAIVNEPHMPQYGGSGIYLNQQLRDAREMKDTDLENFVHEMRVKLFKQRRNQEEQSEKETAGYRKFIKKYGRNGEIAIAWTKQQKQLRSLSTQENKELLESIVATQKAEEKTPPPPPKGGSQ